MEINFIRFSVPPTTKFLELESWLFFTSRAYSVELEITA